MIFHKIFRSRQNHSHSLHQFDVGAKNTPSDDPNVVVLANKIDKGWDKRKKHMKVIQGSKLFAVHHFFQRLKDVFGKENVIEVSAKTGLHLDKPKFLHQMARRLILNNLTFTKNLNETLSFASNTHKSKSIRLNCCP